MEGWRIVFVRPGVAQLQAEVVAVPGADQVLVRNLYSALSAGTERDFLLDETNTGGPFPRYMGYSAVAEVVSCGDGAFRFAPGQHVLVYHGGHRSYSIVEESALSPVAPGIDLLEASMIIIASMGLQGVRKTRLELGEAGLVIGQGLLGLFATQTMRAAGACPVIALDLDPHRLELAKALGAHAAFSPTDPDLLRRIQEATRGRGMDAIVEVTGREEALELALNLAAREARIALTGCTRAHHRPIDFYRLVHKPGVSVIGAHNAVRPAADSRPGYWTREDDYRTLMALMLDGRVKVKPLISKVVSPADCPQIYRELAAGKGFPLGVVFDWGQINI